MNPRFAIRIAMAIVLLVLVAWLAPVATVPANSRGIMTTFGNPSDKIYQPGIHVRIPVMESMNLVNVSIYAAEIETDAASKDLQSVSTKVTINYHVLPDKALYVFRDLQNDPFNVIVIPSTHEALKAITAKYTAEELVSKREAVRDAIIANLKSRLERHGLSIDEFSITNFQFSKSFNEAIEAKTTAEQLKLKAEMDLQTIKVEAEQTVTRAKAQADSLAAQKQEITPDLIELRKVENQASAIEKWDGHLPESVYGTGAMPFIQVQNK